MRDGALDERLQRAVAHYRQGGRREAVACLNTLLAESPDRADAAILRGRILAELGLFDQALAGFDRLLARYPNLAGGWSARGDACRLARQSSEAEADYGRALEADRDHVPALNGCGLLASDFGRWREALALHDRAISLMPESAETHNGRGLALSGLGEHAAALASFARALALHPGYADALINAGNTLRKMGRLEDALASHEKALGLEPASVDALYSRSGVLLELGRYQEALEACEQALALRPAFPPALMRRGNLLNHLNRFEEAVAAFNTALALPDAPAPYRAEAHFLQGMALRHLERMDETIDAFDKAIALRPELVDAWTHRGSALRDMNELLDALHSYDAALAIDPQHAETLNNRSVLMAMLDRNEDAEASAKAALAIDPDSPAAWNNLANSLRRLKRIAEAREAFETATRLSQDQFRVRLNYAMCLLQAGDYENGWEAYEARWETDARPVLVEGIEDKLLRDASQVDGKVVVIYSEQGLGDSIQFSRYVPLLRDRGANVLLGVPKSLRRLYRSLGESITFFDKTIDRSFDFHAPLMSLPRAFGTRLETIPNRVPYLIPPDDVRQSWRERLGTKRGLRVGIVWSGSPGHKEDSGRTIPLEMFATVFAPVPEVYCLQREMRPADVPALAMFPFIRFFGHELSDFADTAALVSEMDLIVSVDTSVLHLAGALARPAWGLIPMAADWRWLYDRDDTPWYPTMRLFRQRSHRGWDEVLQRVAEALALFRPE
jgi:tetratricopeptide (TPR) repeat protein